MHRTAEVGRAYRKACREAFRFEANLMAGPLFIGAENYLESRSIHLRLGRRKFAEADVNPEDVFYVPGSRQ